jgi:hypothetical protein
MISRFFLKLIESGDVMMIEWIPGSHRQMLSDAVGFVGEVCQKRTPPTPREQKIFACFVVASFAALSVFALKVHKDRAANANAALQGVGGNPTAIVSAHQQKER